jgi:hypothetical protein
MFKAPSQTVTQMYGGKLTACAFCGTAAYICDELFILDLELVIHIIWLITDFEVILQFEQIRSLVKNGFHIFAIPRVGLLIKKFDLQLFSHGMGIGVFHE